MKFTTTILTLLALTTAALAIPLPPNAKAHPAAIRPAKLSVSGSRTPVTTPTSKRLASPKALDKAAAVTGKRLATGDAKTATNSKKSVSGKKKPSGKQKPKQEVFFDKAFEKPEAYSKLFKNKDKINRIKDFNGEQKLATYLQKQAKNEAQVAKKMLKQAKAAKYDTPEAREAAIEEAAKRVAKARKDRDAAIRYKKDADGKRRKVQEEVTGEVKEEFQKTVVKVAKQNDRMKKLESDLAGI